MSNGIYKFRRSLALFIALAGATYIPQSAKAFGSSKRIAQDTREEYLRTIAQTYVAPSTDRSMGSLWSAAAPLSDPASDYKAHSVNDTLTVLVSVQTTAAQSGSVNNARDFATNSAITGLFGGLPTTGTNPLLAAQSSNSLKGQGQTASNTTFSTSLTGQVIAVLPNGNLVVEAHRNIEMNNQHEEVIVRGIARIGDISPGNAVPSTALAHLQIELKGKGIISDSVRPPNRFTRAILWLFGF